MADLAARAESLVGRYCTLQQSAELGLELVGLVWQAIGSPETVAATCRASLLVGYPGVVVGAAVVDQLDEIHSRLDDVWADAQANPAAAVVTLPPPLLQRVQEPQARPGRRKAVDEPTEPEPEPTDHLEPEPEPEPTPDPAPLPQRPVKPLRPASERMVRRPDPVELPAPEPWPPMAEPEPEALPVAIAPTPAPPASWLSGNEVAELVGVSRGCVASWRRDGRLGVRNVDWVKYGRSTYFAPAAVEQLEAGRIPAGLDQLVAEVQAP
jgi:hypothetical protein